MNEEYIIKAMARIAFPHHNLRKAKFIEVSGTDIYVEHRYETGMKDTARRLERIQLERYSYKSKKRMVSVWIAYSEIVNPVIFYSELSVVP